ncbi:hypothetical protein FOE78_06290 [Microlunatus elymi]|uniref:SecDF P1 head subdomain domain-containing protein n=1 Tax=Microlunatus elymi TaxID=2596828 RepID=A0A516PWN3_9ACTN|nr:hypothetical protein [Microlunatus elymi]QDP95569.1 hypothetical protein FOE78_06290 [Microlunatus elymi]
MTGALRRCLAWFAILLVCAGTASCGLADRIPPSGHRSTPPAQPRELTAPLLFWPVKKAEPGACPAGLKLAVDDEPNGICLRLGAAALVVDRLKAVSLDPGQSGDWAVDITLADGDAEPFNRLTEELSQQTDPKNRMVLTIGVPPDGRLLTAPSVPQRIDGAQLTISGSFTRDQAERLVHDLGG